jgi:hypothetical protein
VDPDAVQRIEEVLSSQGKRRALGELVDELQRDHPSDPEDVAREMREFLD